jgi:hypothetical protein
MSDPISDPTDDTAPDGPSADDADDADLSTEEYGSLTVEDDPEGTVDPAELAGTADESDHDLPDPHTHDDQG